MRRALCPNEMCRSLILFEKPTTTHVRCSMCQSGDVEIGRLTDVKMLSSIQERTEARTLKAIEMEKRGGFGEARAQTVCRMIDGFLNYDHIQSLWPYFERYGVDNRGRATRLSKMGLTEPINVRRISDYAFGIRNEHIRVARYGLNFEVVDQMKPLLAKIGATLIPLSTEEKTWMWNSAALVTRACVGREAFTRRVVVETIKHLQEFDHEYKIRSSYNQIVWRQIFALDPNKDEAIRLSEAIKCDLDLAAMANVLGRSIVLLDAAKQSTANVFLPFLCPPENCRDRNNQQRPPIILAQSDQGWLRSVLVATTSSGKVDPVYLRREWFQPIWGMTNEKDDDDDLLSQYLSFVDDGRCLVANGVYFKPQRMRKLVGAFEKLATSIDKVHPRLLSEWNRDFGEPMTKRAILELGMKEQLWRCVKCDRLIRLSEKQGRICQWCNTDSHVRMQKEDGIVAYVVGDHTDTPAPKSRCYSKRKHFHEYAEYDNEPQTIYITFRIRESQVRESVKWFRDESKPELNSNFDFIVSALLTRYRDFGLDPDTLMGEIVKKVVDSLDPGTVWQRHREHFENCLGRANMKALLDDSRWTPDETPKKMTIPVPKSTAPMSSPPPSLLTSIEEVEEYVYEILDCANSATKQYVDAWSDAIANSMTAAHSGDFERLTKEINDRQAIVDQHVIQLLEKATISLTDEQRTQIICAKPSVFMLFGFYYHFAKRLFDSHTPHFNLPLFKKLRFAFSDFGDRLVVCLPGDHFQLQGQEYCALMTALLNEPSYPCDYVRPT